MDDELSRVAYESSVRALDKQEHDLEELRARTAVLLAASSLAVSLLGRSALEKPHPPALLVAALTAFATSIGASVFVLLPRPAFVFEINGPAVYEGLYEFRDDPSEMHRRLAYALRKIHRSNERMLRPLVVAVRISALSLAAEIVLLTLIVSTTPVSNLADKPDTPEPAKRPDKPPPPPPPIPNIGLPQYGGEPKTF
jgi:hypothetical protein